jgi:hypothetical protein
MHGRRIRAGDEVCGHGTCTLHHRDGTRAVYKDIMCPRDPFWRRMVLSEGPRLMDQLMAGVRAWGA